MELYSADIGMLMSGWNILYLDEGTVNITKYNGRLWWGLIAVQKKLNAGKFLKPTICWSNLGENIPLLAKQSLNWITSESAKPQHRIVFRHRQYKTQ
jgi:hypothetical protein